MRSVAVRAAQNMVPDRVASESSDEGIRTIRSSNPVRPPAPNIGSRLRRSLSTFYMHHSHAGALWWLAAQREWARGLLRAEQRTWRRVRGLRLIRGGRTRPARPRMRGRRIAIGQATEI